MYPRNKFVVKKLFLPFSRFSANALFAPRLSNYERRELNTSSSGLEVISLREGGAGEGKKRAPEE